MCDPKMLLCGLEALAIELSAQGEKNILIYCRELLKWNKRINLVARSTTAGEALEKHFLDSLTLLPCVAGQGRTPSSLLDVGSGAGFPGLVLAAVIPELAVTLVEPRQKRVAFLRHISRTLRLDNVRIIADRLEHSGLNKKNFQYITSRAVTDRDRFLAMVADFVNLETTVIVMQAVADMDGWADSSGIKGWHLIEQKKMELPFSGASRVLSMISKQESCLSEKHYEA